MGVEKGNLLMVMGVERYILTSSSCGVKMICRIGGVDEGNLL